MLAIGTGISDGMGYGANTRIALITRGLAEMARLGEASGARPETFAGLARKSPLTSYSESILRLINARFPEGEPKPGDFIKVIE